MTPGCKKALDNIQQLETPKIETCINQYSNRDYEVEIAIPEYTSICAKDKLPDFGTITIRYIPDEECVEIKSLKKYISFYRNIEITHEHIINKILDDFIEACQPRRVEVLGNFNVEYGTQTTVKAKWRNKQYRRWGVNITFEEFG